MPVPVPDRATILASVMPALLAAQVEPIGDPEDVGAARVVASRGGVIAGIPVAKEVFGRLGIRTRALAGEGDVVPDGAAVAEVGGATAAIRGAAPLALGFLQRLSAIASGAAPAGDDPLEMYAARLSPDEPVQKDGPSFHLEFD